MATKDYKILALYLPQFHRIQQNDIWWGDGFTEWNIVRNAKPIDNKNFQPRIPLMGYYDLSSADVLHEQAHLAREYGVDGFIIYSYYSNGKTLLDKPIKLLYENKEIDVIYCFSWANHDWRRTWFDYDQELLVKQEYGDTYDEIKEHFYYLLPFFKDKRYFKINNSPVFMIYDYLGISNIKMYKKIWNELCRKEGFESIYFVQTLGETSMRFNNEIFDACFDFEPSYTVLRNMRFDYNLNICRRILRNVFKQIKPATIYIHKKVCNAMIKREEKDSNHCLGIMAEWDNTPRHKNNGTLLLNFSMDDYRLALMSQLIKTQKYKRPFIVFDAWNEWGEGAMLEPDNVYQYRKLEILYECIKEIER